MDIRRRCVETTSAFLNTNGSPGTHSPRSEHTPSPPNTTVTPPSKPAVKRSFDVAFLMAPDDSSKKRQQEELKEHLRLVNTGNLVQRYSPILEKDTRVVSAHNYPESPIGLLMPSKQTTEIEVQRAEQFTKSAFTKVANPVARVDVSLTGSPTMSPAVSPDLSYPDSMSPPSRPRTPPQYYAKPVQYFPTSKPTIATSPYLYQPSICRDKTRSSPPEETFQGTFNKSSEEKGSTSKRLYPGEVLPYSGLAMAAAYPFPAAPFTGSGSQVPAILTAAANVTAALLPPSLAALTLPAQNVCAKCNISFRMTSDLVYHMRSQHKSEHSMADSNRRRREQDKLRCPVCNESFRERHHLTRHMTAHQDKDGDKVDDEEDLTARKRLNK